jgi:O-antigen/teichoic acid export membrane protein
MSPRDFGIFAMANATSIIINVFMQFGLAKYLVREQEVDRKLLRSLFTVNVLMSLLYTAGLLVASVVYRLTFSSPEVSNFLFVFAFFPLIGMFEFIPSALLAREMRFQTIAALMVLKTVALAAMTIALALLGFAYMSFAWAMIFSWAVGAVAYNFVLWRPDAIGIRFAGIRSILSFGVQMVGVSGLSQLSTRIGEMVLGSLLGLASLGLYTRAASTPTTLQWNLFGATTNVIFSKMAQDLREHGSLDRTYSYFMRILLGLFWPMMVGLAILARPFIAILYGAKWLEAALPLSLLCIATAVVVGMGLTAELFILRHRTKQQVTIEAVRSVIGLALFVGGALISLGLAAAAKVAEALVAFGIYFGPMMQLIGGPPAELRRLYVQSFLLTVAAVLPSLCLMLVTGFSPSTPLLLILGSVVLGVGLWGAALIALRHPILAEATKLLTRLR